MADYPVITIGRQYAAGGRTVAKLVSEALDIPYYDKDFVKKTADESGYTVEDINREGEEMTKHNSFWNTVLNNSTSYTSSFDGIYKAERNTTIELAQSPCILVGRSANAILKENNIKAFNVFLYADLDFRIKRAEELNDYGDTDVEKYVRRRDALRETYCKVYSELDMNDLRNYDLCINTGAVGYEKAAELIIASIKEMA